MQPGENIITTIFGLEQGLEVNFLIDQRKNRRILKDIKYRFGTTDNDLEWKMALVPKIFPVTVILLSLDSRNKQLTI